MFLICVHGTVCVCAAAELENNECVLLIWALGERLSLLRAASQVCGLSLLSLHFFFPPLAPCM